MSEPICLEGPVLGIKLFSLLICYKIDVYSKCSEMLGELTFS